MMFRTRDMALLHRMEAEQGIAGNLDHYSYCRDWWVFLLIKKSVLVYVIPRISVAFIITTMDAVIRITSSPLAGILYYLSVGVTALVSGLILYRILLVVQQCDVARSRYAFTFEVIIESGAIYSITLLMVAILPSINSDNMTLWRVHLVFYLGAVPITVCFFCYFHIAEIAPSLTVLIFYRALRQLW